MLSRENGARVLHWMRAEFDGVKSQLHAMASSLAHQQALVADLASNRVSDMNGALAELEGSATQLRTEASRMRRDAGGLQEDGAELRRESARLREIEREMSERLPQVVAEAVQPELRAALREVEAITAGLREEASQLRAVRDGLNDQLPRLVEAAVRAALANFTPAPAAPAAAPAPSQSSSEANGFAPDPAAVEAGRRARRRGRPGRRAHRRRGRPRLRRPARRPPRAGGGGRRWRGRGPSGLHPARPRRRTVAGPGRQRGAHPGRPPAPAPAPGQLAVARACTGATPTPPTSPAGSTATPGPGPTWPRPAGRRKAGGGQPLGGGHRLPRRRGGRRRPGRAAAPWPCSGRRRPTWPAPWPRRSSPRPEAPARRSWSATCSRPPRSSPASASPATWPRRCPTWSATTSPAPRWTLVVARDPSPEDLAELLRLAAAGRGPPRAGRPGRHRTRGHHHRAPRGQRAGGRGGRRGRAGRPAGRRPALHPRAARRPASCWPCWPAPAPTTTSSPPSSRRPSPSRSPWPSRRRCRSSSWARTGSRSAAPRSAPGCGPRPGSCSPSTCSTPPAPRSTPPSRRCGPRPTPGGGRSGSGPPWATCAAACRDATGEKKLKVIERDGDRYRVEPLFDVDLWRLEQALGEGAAGADDFVRAAAYDRVAQTYAGDLLAGADWAWAETPREDLRQRVLDVQVWLGDIRWASGDARGSWQALQRAVEVDPYAEQIYRRIMRLQSKLGRPDDAAATYRRLQARLVEIDLEPTPESEKLHAELSG